MAAIQFLGQIVPILPKWPHEFFTLELVRNVVLHRFVFDVVKWLGILYTCGFTIIGGYLGLK